MVRLDFPVPGVFIPQNGIFITNEQLEEERAKAELKEKVIVKINPELAPITAEKPGKLKKGTVEAFLQEKLEEIKSRKEGSNLAFGSEDKNFTGRGVVIPGLSPEVLEVLFSLAQHHHQGQTRKDAVGTDYLAHIMGVVSRFT